MTKKSWFKSKTIIFNAAVAALATAEAGTGLLQPLLPVNFYALLVFVLPVVNAALRAITSVPITCKS